MNFRALALAVVIALAVACSRDPQPSKSDIEQAIAAVLPAFARVSSLSVEAIQNMGTQVEPLWQGRFRATVKVSAATFASDGADNGVVFVRPVKQQGDSTEFFGKSISRLYAGSWRTSVEFEGQRLDALGLPGTAFGPGKLIVRGSKAETTYLAEQAERQRRASAAAARQAEEQRIADERAGQERERRLRAELTILESPDCIEGEQHLSSNSQRSFVLNPKRSCWTPWLVLGSQYYTVTETGNVLIQLVRSGTIANPFEAGPKVTWNANDVQKIRFKSLGREPVTISGSSAEPVGGFGRRQVAERVVQGDF
jgi:hypothetical protein